MHSLGRTIPRRIIRVYGSQHHDSAAGKSVARGCEAATLRTGGRCGDTVGGARLRTKVERVICQVAGSPCPAGGGRTCWGEIREDETSVGFVLSRTTEKFRSQLVALPKPVQDKATSAYAL